MVGLQTNLFLPEGAIAASATIGIFTLEAEWSREDAKQHSNILQCRSMGGWNAL